jgi:hypothetical protein
MRQQIPDERRQRIITGTCPDAMCKTLTINIGAFTQDRSGEHSPRKNDRIGNTRIDRDADYCSGAPASCHPVRISFDQDAEYVSAGLLNAPS